MSNNYQSQVNKVINAQNLLIDAKRFSASCDEMENNIKYMANFFENMAFIFPNQSFHQLKEITKKMGEKFYQITRIMEKKLIDYAKISIDNEERLLSELTNTGREIDEISSFLSDIDF